MNCTEKLVDIMWVEYLYNCRHD